jgi:membrane protease YdiL (CAAX protease family)
MIYLIGFRAVTLASDCFWQASTKEVQAEIIMKHPLFPAIAGLLSAIVITTTMDATGYSMFSALPLILLTGLFWYLQKFTKKEIGLTLGNWKSHGWAVAYPLLVLGLTAAIAWFFGAIDTSEADWNKTILNVGLMSSTGVIMVMITEEGFFRGWLWAALKRAGRSDLQILLITSLGFTLWHVSAISLDTGFDIPLREIPIYLISTTILGLIWGILRMVSGSVLVPAVSHAVWNGIDYPLYGFGEKVGALGITDTHLFGPEVGLLGILLGLAFLALIWRKYVTAELRITSHFH